MPKINDRNVGPIVYGLMGLTWRRDPSPQDQAFAAMRAALDAGCNLWNGGEFYGSQHYNSAVPLRRFLAAHPSYTSRIVLSIKGGHDVDTLAFDGGPDGMRRSLDNTLPQLGGCLPQLDLFGCGRLEPAVPLAASLGTVQHEFETPTAPGALNKLGAISLSECSAATIHEAIATGFPITAVEVELSLWSTKMLHNGVAAACARYDIPIVAYLPIARGALTGAIRTPADIPPDDPRYMFPRFHPDNLPANLRLVDHVRALAGRKGCTPAQLAINWVRCQSGRPGMPSTVIPILGTSTPERVRENSTMVEISDAKMDELDGIVAQCEIKGGRYPDHLPHDT